MKSSVLFLHRFVCTRVEMCFLCAPFQMLMKKYWNGFVALMCLLSSIAFLRRDSMVCDGHWSIKIFVDFFRKNCERHQPVSRPRELWLLRETNESGSLYPSPLGLSLLRSSDESRSPSAKSFFTLNDVIDSCNFCCCCCNRALIAWIFGILFASSFVHSFK